MKKFYFIIFIALIVFISGCISTPPLQPSDPDPFTCSEASSCGFVFLGENQACPACDKGDENWVCRSNTQAGLIQVTNSIQKITGFISTLFQGENISLPSCPCPTQEFEYECSCENGKCAKIRTGKNPDFCRQSQDCESNDLVHIMCVGNWACGENTCKWECDTGPSEEVISDVNGEVEPVEPVIRDCGEDKECFEEALLSCEKAVYSSENTFFRAGIVVRSLVEKEIVGVNEDGYCSMTLKETSQTGAVKESECLYEALHQLKCAVKSSSG